MINVGEYLSPRERAQRAEATEQREAAQRAAKRNLVVGARTADESAVLDVLRKDGPHDNVADIVTKTGLTAATVSLVISDLVARKLIERTEDGMFGQRARISAHTIEAAATTVAQKATREAIERTFPQRSPARTSLFP